MEPIKYVDAMTARYGAMGFPPYNWSVNETAPWAPLSKPLNDCTVALLVSGGISHCSAEPFNPDARNDHRLDAIDPDVSTDSYQIHDNYYKHADAEQDLNCIFPIDRLRELSDAGVIGRVAPRHWSGFMGRTYNRSKLIEESAPAFAEELRADDIDLLVAIPACPLDHQTIGLVARVVEEAGIPTVNVSTGRDITALVRPPRSLFVNAPLGNTFGRPGDADRQRDILGQALDLAATANEPGVLVDIMDAWDEPFEYHTGDITPEAIAKQLKK